MSRADMDEITMLTDIIRNNLPDKFIKLVIAADEDFPSSDEGRFELLQRLEKILEVAIAFPGAYKTDEIGNGLLPTFELSKSDQSRVFELCDQMRKIVFASAVFDEPHKRRLLDRVAAIEQQVHQKKGKFDVILGGISDIGETLGKFGVDIKPLTDRMNEVVKITRKGTKEYDQLPAPEEVKQLPPPKE
jgi:hypothetical protein